MFDNRINRRSLITLTPVTRPQDLLTRYRLRWIAVITLACVLAALYFVYSEPAKAEATSSCIICHSNLEPRLSDPVKAFEHDIHKSKGLSCTDCHGGNSASTDKVGAKSPSYGFHGKPTAQQIPGFCGKCHSDASLMKKFNPSLRVDQVPEYATSTHGKKLQGGDQKVATCVSCHGVHGIRAPDDPQSTVYPLNVAETCGKCHGSAEHMSGYNIAHDQYDKYKSSVHANALYEKKDLSAPTCNDCHGNHGAAPPGLTSVANVCGQCHARQAELFQKGPHKAPFDKEQSGECLKCHNNHDIAPPTDQMTGVGPGSVCVSCHKDDKGFAVAQRIGKGLDEVSGRVEQAKERLENAERAGMEVSRPKFELQDAQDGITQARVLIHTSSAEEVEKALTPAMDVANKSFEAGNAAFAELGYRRSGLAISLVFILFLAGLVYLKIRQIESEPPPVET